MKFRAILAGLVFLATLPMTGTASASCFPVSKEFALAYYDLGNYWIQFQPGDDTTTNGGVIGRLWEPGARDITGDQAGECDDTVYLLDNQSDATQKTIFGGNASDFGWGACYTGCPNSALIMVIQTKALNGLSASYTVGKVSETFTAPSFDYARTGGNWDMVPMPKPILSNVVLASNLASFDVSLPSPDAAVHTSVDDGYQPTSIVTGYQLVSAVGTSTLDPGRNPASRTPLGSVIPTSSPSTSLSNVFCPPGNQIYVATRVVFDDGQFSSDYVSGSTKISCSAPTYSGCAPVSKEFSLGYNDTGNFDIVFPPNAETDINAGVIGHLWQPGQFALTGDLSGAGCPDNLWLYPPSAGGTMTVYGSNGSDLGNGQCDSGACPAGAMIVLVQTKSNDGTNAFFTIGRVIEGAPLAFDFARTLSNWTMVPIPKPQVTNSSRTATEITVDVVLAPPDPAFHAPTSDGQVATNTLTAYQLVSFIGSADPGRAASAWTTTVGLPVTTTSPSRSGITADCPAGSSLFLANRPVFDNGQLQGDYVSASTRIACSNIASPGVPRLKPIGRKSVAEANGKKK